MVPQPSRHLRRALIAAFIAVALVASLGIQAVAEEESPQVVTELQPGLNPIDWVNLEAPSSGSGEEG